MDMDASAEAGEAELITRAQRGDLLAFETLVRQHQARVRHQLRRLLPHDVDLAEDLAQDCFIQAWRQLPQFRGEARLSTWLHRIALRAFLMDRRRHREQPWPGDEDAQDRLVTDDGDPALRMDVDRAVARLPPHERLAIVHCFELDLTHEEAAAVLGLPLGTLKAQVARAKVRLREWLAPWNVGGPR
jgi:RNA polymerase sigma-70 factor (ECF subfamily)